MRVPFKHLCTQIRRFTDPSIVHKDIIYLNIKAGNGGNGIAKYNGVGGNGGSVYVQPTSTAFSQMCIDFKDKRTAKGEPGTNSMQVKLAGAHGEPRIIHVPIGVECVNATTRMLIARCNMRGKQYLIAKGGVGGSHANQYKGQKGEHLQLAIHFKLTTNVGFVGLPNAGKSTLLKALVPAKTIKIADYPFTTLKPQVLDVKFEEENEAGEKDDPGELFSLSVADLPGIIEGASRNRGRGYAFLKHLEYSEIIIMVVDVHGFKLSDNFDEPFRDAMQSIAVLNCEMEKYDTLLVKKPMILVLNKTDLNDGKEKADKIVEHMTNEDWYKDLPASIRPTLPIKFKAVLSLSAKDGEILSLKTVLRKMYSALHPIESVNFDEHIDELDGSSGKFMF